GSVDISDIGYVKSVVLEPAEQSVLNCHRGDRAQEIAGAGTLSRIAGRVRAVERDAIDLLTILRIEGVKRLPEPPVVGLIRRHRLLENDVGIPRIARGEGDIALFT